MDEGEEKTSQDKGDLPDLGDPQRSASQEGEPSQRQNVRKEFYSGPLPAPDDAREFEKIEQGSFDRILSMAEKEQEHRHQQEKDNLSYNVKLNSKSINTDRLSIILFSFICLTAIGSGAYLIVNGHPVTGLGSIVSGLGILGGAFYKSLQSRS